ncbi:MAG: sucrase ferredoxin, partial [Candidatus Dormibacteraceae bacterium]
CCGKLGYPIVRGIAKESGFASRVWRTTHVGGDRFAPNLVCLPYGTYHGQVPLEDATLVAEYSLKGRVMLPYYRGRAGYSYAAQRADAWARKCRGGGDDVFGVSYLGEQSLSDDMTMVHLAVGGMELQVPVRAHQLSKRPMSCGGPIGQPTAYEVEVEDCRQGP